MAEAVAFPSLHDADDSHLIEAVRKGDVEAYGVLYYRHCTSAMTVARRWTTSQSQAEDLVAESFTAVLDALRRGKGPTDNFPTYLATAVRNLSARWAERSKRICTVEDLELAVSSVEHSPAAEDTVLDLSERELVAGAFRRLPERDRMVLWLVDVEDHSYAEAAVKMGLTPNGVGTLLSRAREGLRDEFVASHIEVKAGADSVGQGPVGFARPGSSWRASDGSNGVNPASLNHPSALRLSRFARGKTPPRYRPTIELHLAMCPRCRLLMQEAREVGSTVRGLAAPMLLAPFVLNAPGGSPPPPVPPFPVDGSAGGAWLGAKGVYFGVGAVVVIGAVVFSIAQLQPDAAPEPETRGSQAPVVIPTESIPVAALTIHWDRGDSTEIPAGRSLELPFTITANIAVPSTASVSFIVPEGSQALTRSPACTQAGSTLLCGGIGPFDEGQVMHGKLVVDLGVSGPPPAASIAADGSWPSAAAGEDAIPVTAAGGVIPVTEGKDDVTVRGVSVPMFGSTTTDPTGRNVQYVPNVGYRGIDGFTVTSADGGGQTAISTIGVVVTNP